MGHDEHNFDEVGELLSSLKRVEPPGDFDMRVRARIAQGRPTTARRWPLVLARIGVPAAVLIALGGYFGWNALNQPVDVPVVADVQQQSQPEQRPAQLPIDQRTVEPDQLFASRNTESGKNPQEPGPVITVPDRIDPTEQGTSEDFGITPGRRVLPRGLDPDRVITNANVSGNSRRSATEVLSMLGIAASCSTAGCRVGSVVASSVAEKSGIRRGDVIESIDGRSLLGNAPFSGSFSAASVRVRRDGLVVNIPLRP